MATMIGTTISKMTQIGMVYGSVLKTYGQFANMSFIRGAQCVVKSARALIVLNVSTRIVMCVMTVSVSGYIRMTNLN